MPFQSQQQAKAMFSAAEGKSNIGIPKTVGQEFVAASAGKPTSALPEYADAQRGHKAKTHRGRRSKGKGAKQHHTDAKAHAAKALAAPTPAVGLQHLFKAVRSMHAAKQAMTPSQPAAAPDGDETGPGY